MKPCSSCKILKSLSDFHKSSKAKDGLQSRCVECNKQQRKAYYKTAHGRDKNSTTGKRWSIRGAKRLFEYLQEHPCIQCGETDVILLDFDHRDPKTKEHNISQLIRKVGWDKVLEEINKCDVLCVSCHRRKTAKQFGWYKALWQSEYAQVAEG